MGKSVAEIYKNFSDEVRVLNADLLVNLGMDAIFQRKAPVVSADQIIEKPKRANKYNARKIEADGKTFDSRAEYRRYLALKSQQDAGEISDLACQFEIVLLPGFVYKGEKVRPIRYTADFRYAKGENIFIEDVKSVATARTTDFRIRWRLLQWMFRDDDDVILLLTS